MKTETMKLLNMQFLPHKPHILLGILSFNTLNYILPLL
jgi:hypothetical protein